MTSMKLIVVVALFVVLGVLLWTIFMGLYNRCDRLVRKMANSETTLAANNISKFLRAVGCYAPEKAEAYRAPTTGELYGRHPTPGP